MTRLDKRSLTNVLATCVWELSEATGGSFTSRELIDRAEARFPEVVEEYRDRMYREGIRQAACQVMRNMAPRDLFGQPLQLPLELDGLRLPHVISVPGKEDDDDAWVPLCKATWAQFTEHVRFLQKQIENDQRRLRDLLLLQDYLTDKVSADGQQIGVFLGRHSVRAAA